jgi:tetratricopeptide (TPR) repeat protein
MIQTNEPTGQPSLNELFSRYLHQQTDAQAQGLGYAEPLDEVVPHDTTPMQPGAPRLAWGESLAVASHLLPGQSVKGWTVAPEWPTLVAEQEPAFGLAFAFGNFPQLVRNLQPLLSGQKLTPPAPVASSTASNGVQEWADRLDGSIQALLAAGVLRLARQFDRAEKLLTNPALKSQEAARVNELAALAWHRGQGEQALALWRALPDSVPALFNRGMAALFLGHTAQAAEDLTQAVSRLPETSAWHHLGQLYLALATIR